MKNNSGKTKLVLKATPEAFDYLQKLNESGELNQLLGATITNISAWENLSHWFNNIFGTSWQPIPIGYHTRSYESASKTRMQLINLEDVKDVTVKMILGIKPIETNKTEIIIKIYPQTFQLYLPEGLQLIATDELDNIVSKTKAKHKDNFLCLSLKSSSETKFKLKIISKSSQIVKRFYIDKIKSQIIKNQTTIRLTISDKIDYKALQASLDKVKRNHKGTQFSIQRIESQKNQTVLVTLEVISDINKELLEKDIVETYESILQDEEKRIISVSDCDSICLREWFEGWFIGGWQLEELASPTDSDTTGEPLQEAKGIKLINLRGKVLETSLKLKLQIKEITSLKFDVSLFLYPSHHSIYLPHRVQMMVLDDSGQSHSSLTTQAKGTDNWLQLKFTASLNDRFSIKIKLDQQILTEQFII